MECKLTRTLVTSVTVRTAITAITITVDQDILLIENPLAKLAIARHNIPAVLAAIKHCLEQTAEREPPDA